MQIHHPEKVRYDYVVPLATGALSWIAYQAITPELPIFGEAGLLKFTREFLIMAVPFMVGALASVAMGFPGQHIDRRPPGAELLLDGRVLTLRQFVCYLLGYLCFVAFVTLIGSIVAPLVQPTISKVLASEPFWNDAVFRAGTLVLFQLVAILVVTTLWALYFLTDIINRPAGSE
ncbi:MAG: hypothetical protein KDJ44_00680 [Rhodoblastus sp.]|nr:hypothetical protein [Rhodoblastus sp.]